VQQVETEDLIAYGMIPELIGRIPVILPFEDLNQSTLKRILVEPKNAITKQFQKLFQLENIELVFEDEALDQIASQVTRTRTGARGLRRVIERILINSQYLIPQLKQEQVKKLIVNKSTVIEQKDPEKVVD
jgi:ATP-dependent Clp protease ATP-binding subunit ClpX